MKKALKFLGIIVLLLVAAIIVLPIVFKDDIVKLVKAETNKALNAKVDFGDFDLSLIRSFPDFSFQIEKVSVSGIDQFEGVDLATLKELSLVVDVMSVINGETINIKQISLVEPNVNAIVLKDGSANYLIAKEDSTATVEAVDTSASDFSMELQEFKITAGKIFYKDETLPMEMKISNLNLDLKGDMTQDITNILVKGGIDEFNLSYDGIQCMNDMVVDLDADIAMNLEEFKFTFNENELKVNELPLGFDGWVAMPNEAIDMDFTFFAKQTDFKELLSMIPADFAKDLEGVETSGKLELNGYAKGTFIDSTYPGFGLNMAVENGRFNYPDLPKSVEDIQIKASVDCKDGNLDHTIVDVPRFHLELADNPIDMTFYLATPMSDPFIKASLVGKLILSNIKDIVPLEKGDELAGTIDSKLSIEGQLSTLEDERYEEFKALGSIAASKVHYNSDSLDYPIDVPSASMQFSPKYVELSNLVMKLGKSDISAKGRLENFIGYALSDNQTLRGTLDVSSSLMDINELAGIEPAEETSQTIDTSTTDMEAVILPKYIDFVTTAAIDKLIYDNVIITNIKGEIDLKEQKIAIKNTAMNLLDGSLNMNGFYETTDSLKPSYDFAMDIKNFDVKKTVETFNTVETMAPIAKNATGDYSTKMTVKGALDSKMEPIYETMFGKGVVNTRNIAIEGYKPLQKVAKAIKYDQLDPLGLDDIAISFQIVDGKVLIEPFVTKIGDTKLTIAGSNSFDQTIDYVFSFAIPRKELGSAANNAVDGLLSQASSKGIDVKLAETINVDVQLVGPAADPTIKTNFSQTKSNVTNAIKDKAKEEFNKKKEELKKQAEEEIDKQKQEAKKRAQEEIDKQKQELEKQKEAAKKKLEEEAKKKLKGLFK